MKTSEHTYFNRSTDTKFELEASDFGYLSKEFTAKDGSIGIDLVSIKNPLLSIHIGKFGIKYDNDISARGGFVAVERVDINKNLLYHIGETVHNFQAYIPNTSDQLSELVDEFKYKGLGNVMPEHILEYLSK